MKGVGVEVGFGGCVFLGSKLLFLSWKTRTW